MIKIRDSIKLFYNYSTNKVKVVFMNKHESLVIKCNEVGRAILNILSTKVTTNRLIHIVKKRYSGVSEKDIKEFLIAMYNLKIIETVRANKYRNSIVSRQVNLYSDIVNDSVKMQDELGKKTVLILGLGGSGSCIAYFLVQSGINHFILLDHDRVENTNLGRQALYFREDIGEYKVDVIAKRLKCINPNVTVERYKISISCEEDFKQVLSIPDIVINCLDEPNSYFTGKWVSNYYLEHNVPTINGIGYRGSVIALGLTTLPGKTICWNCANEDYENENGGYLPFLTKSHKSQAGVSSPLANFIAAIYSQEVINVLSKDLSPILVNRIGIIDFTTLEVKWNNLSFGTRNCSICKKGDIDD